MQSNPKLYNDYREFLAKYEELGHMTRILEESVPCPNYYIPHHAVIKADSTTTKLRVVFDGSAKTSTDISLNDLQLKGPTLQRDLMSLLINHRIHNFIVSADVQMMYRQILVKPEQRPLQRILWRNNSSIPVYTYQLNTVTYGLTSSSFLAIRCLFELAQQIHETDPEAANIIRNNMYVDDLLVGFDNEEQALKTCQRLESILRAAGFPLRKWISNNNSITSFMERESSNTNMSLSFDTGESAKILGLYWMPTNDTLNYKCASSLHKSENITKRQVLSAITRIFDPLGLLSPCVVKAKILMQSIWSNKIN